MLEKERRFVVDPTIALQQGYEFHPFFAERRVFNDVHGVDHVLIPGKTIESCYFTKGPTAVRTTYRDDGRRKFAVKTPTPDPAARNEFEIKIPKLISKFLLWVSPTRLMKTRYELDGWEIDVYHDIYLHEVTGDVSWLDAFSPQLLTIAEYEEAPGKRMLERAPDWMVLEVTGDKRFSNQSLAWQFGREKWF